jgi:hypothetical protein
MHQAVQSGVRSEGDGAGAEAPAGRYLAVHQHVRRWRTGPDAVRGGVLPVRAALRHDERPDSHLDADDRGSRAGRDRVQRQDECPSGGEVPRVNDDGVARAFCELKELHGVQDLKD